MILNDAIKPAHTGHAVSLALRGLAALLFGLVAFMTLGSLAVLYMVDVWTDVLLAVIAAVTPPA